MVAVTILLSKYTILSDKIMLLVVRIKYVARRQQVQMHVYLINNIVIMVVCIEKKKKICLENCVCFAVIM